MPKLRGDVEISSSFSHIFIVVFLTEFTSPYNGGTFLNGDVFNWHDRWKT